MATGGSTTVPDSGTTLFNALTDGGAVRRIRVKNAVTSANKLKVRVHAMHNENQEATLEPGESEYFEIGGRVNGIERVTAIGDGGNATAAWYVCSKS